MEMKNYMFIVALKKSLLIKNKIMTLKIWISNLLLLLIFGTSFAKVKPNSLFSDNVVLQRGVIVSVWGIADEGENVSVVFNGQQVSTVTKNGKWLVQLAPMQANTNGQTMVIKGTNTVIVKNVLIGEVWFCSGQSNMAFTLGSIKPLGSSLNFKQVLEEAARYPLIRQFTMPLIKSSNIPDKIFDVNGKWFLSDSTRLKNFSAVAYFFAKALYNKLKVPIGIINSSYGGTAIENWMSKETLDTIPASKSIFASFEKSLNEFPSKLAQYQSDEKQLLDKYALDSAESIRAQSALPRKPSVPMSPAERGGPTGLYNTMIYPLVPFAIRGVAWYQGEANASRGIQYRSLFPVLIQQFRKEWDNENLPFFFIQLPGWKNHFPEIKEAQLMTYQKVPFTAMTVIYDCDDTLDVHPANKQPVGERLSLPARALVYGEDKIEYMGPIYDGMKIEGNKIILSFSHAKKLVAKDGPLRDFLIAGADKKFIPAQAEIKNGKVVVFCESITNPVAVRAGWRFCPQMNLYNEAGLPASPFRTDTF